MSKQSKLIEVKWFSSGKSLSEIYQQTGMIFSFVSSPKDGYRMCHDWVKCRDFLHDAVRAQALGDSCSIYGFIFDAGINPPIDLKKMRMLVSKHDLKKGDQTAILAFKDKMKSSLELLHHYEKYAGVSLSRLKEVNPEKSGKAAVYLFISPVMWMTSPFLVSMYSFLIRLGDKQIKFSDEKDLINKFRELYEANRKAPKSDNDCTYLGNTGDIMHTVISKRNTLFLKENGLHNIYFKKIGINNFHNSSGIKSLSQGITPDKELNKTIDLLRKEIKN